MAMADLVKERARAAVTAERFSQGMTFDQYVTYTGTPANLAREAGWWLGPKRMDFSGLLRARYEKDGQTYQSVPVAVFYTGNLRYLYHYTEYPAIYHKDRLAGAMQVARAGETTREQTWDRFIRDWGALQESPFYTMWTCAAVDEILSALHERIVVGSPA
jgi:hypothetical protein